LSSEYIVSADPDLIFLADVLYGESAETVAARPGWDVLTAVREGNVVELDSDIASRWGPRIVDFAQGVADAVEAFVSRG
jgi:iron complex transport system substrate-binding protein